MVVSSAVIAAPFIMNMAGLFPDVKGEEKQYTYTISPTCIGCHYCFYECPAGAIHWGDNKYEIDQKKCTRCGICEKVCNISAVTHK